MIILQIHSLACRPSFYAVTFFEIIWIADFHRHYYLLRDFDVAVKMYLSCILTTYYCRITYLHNSDQIGKEFLRIQNISFFIAFRVAMTNWNLLKNDVRNFSNFYISKECKINAIFNFTYLPSIVLHWNEVVCASDQFPVSTCPFEVCRTTLMCIW